MKKYLIILALAGMIFSSCSKELEITPPNSITDEQIMELLASGDDATIKKILGSMADAMPRPAALFTVFS